MQSRAHSLKFILPLAIVVTLAAAGAFAAIPLGTTFTYQGRLTESGSPVNGNADFQMNLWDGPTPGSSSLVTPIFQSSASVADGTFTIDLNFGPGVFNGDERWLEIAVRFPAGIGSFTTLTPRQRLNAAPYALALPGMFTQPNSTSPNIIGGFKGNTITPNVIGATISGGGRLNFVNSATDDFGTIGGGQGNSAGLGCTIGGGTVNVASDVNSTIGGGSSNTANGSHSTIGGGGSNSTSENHSTVGGGEFNTASESHATVSGGQSNTASGTNATIGGGVFNESSSPGLGASTVGGGWDNSATAEFSTVAGGFQNTASGSSSTVVGGASNTASGSSSTVAGGAANTASGAFSFAAGRRAKADFNGSFVWGDSTNADVHSGGTNTFNVRASGGTAFYSNSAATAGVLLAPGGGSWSGFSDCAGKSNIQPVNPRIALQKVVQLPISTWNYNAQDESIRHIGPMAQDFHAAFGVGEDDKHITTIDADGVALSAIQGLHLALVERDAAISLLRETAAAQASELAQLKAQFGELRASLPSPDQTEYVATSRKE